MSTLAKVRHNCSQIAAHPSIPSCSAATTAEWKLTPKHPGLVVAGGEGLPDAREPGLLAHDVVLRLGADRSLRHPLHEAVQGLDHATHVPLGGDSMAMA